MKVELKTIFNTQALIAELASSKLPAKTSYKISRILVDIVKETQIYEKERIKLCEEAAERNENGKPIVEDNSYKLTADKMAVLNQQLLEIQDQEVELWGEAIRVEELGDLAIEPNKLLALGWLIKAE